jgi:hypothetical protein
MQTRKDISKLAASSSNARRKAREQSEEDQAASTGGTMDVFVKAPPMVPNLIQTGPALTPPNAANQSAPPATDNNFVLLTLNETQCAASTGGSMGLLVKAKAPPPNLGTLPASPPPVKAPPQQLPQQRPQQSAPKSQQLDLHRMSTWPPLQPPPA